MAPKGGDTIAKKVGNTAEVGAQRQNQTDDTRIFKTWRIAEKAQFRAMFVCLCRAGAAEASDPTCFAAMSRARADQEAAARFDTRGSRSEVPHLSGRTSEAAWEGLRDR